MIELEPGDIGPGRCPVCAYPVGPPGPSSPGVRWCKSCRTAHHSDCWDFNGAECAVYGCSPRKSLLVIEDDSDLIPIGYGRVDPTLPIMAALAVVALLNILLMMG